MGLIVLIEMRIVLIVMPIDRRTDQSKIAKKALTRSTEWIGLIEGTER